MSYIFKINYADKTNYGSYRDVNKIKYIVWHYTANDGDTDESNAKWFKTPNRKASSHYFVDDDSITISVPDTYVAWSVGGTRYSNYKITGGASLYKICTNTNSINIELCDTVKNGKYDVSESTLSNAIELTRILMEKYNIPISRVVRHFDVTGKSCPSYYVDSTAWNNVRNRIVKSTTHSESEGNSSYSKVQFIKDVQSAIGANVDGIAGKETLSKTVSISKSKNNRHAVVKPLQRYLNFLGYNCGNADGVAGQKFHSAAIAYQKANGCIADGEFTKGKASWKKILGL